MYLMCMRVCVFFWSLNTWKTTIALSRAREGRRKKKQAKKTHSQLKWIAFSLNNKNNKTECINAFLYCLTSHYRVHNNVWSRKNVSYMQLLAVTHTELQFIFHSRILRVRAADRADICISFLYLSVGGMRLKIAGWCRWFGDWQRKNKSKKSHRANKQATK